MLWPPIRELRCGARRYAFRAAEVRVNRSATTDAEGRYEFPDLPAGRYNVSVSRSGFVSLSFGQQRPFEQGRPLDLGNGQQADKIDFALPRGGVIAGRVTDEIGEPLAGIRVQAMRYQYLPNGRRQLTPVSGSFFGGLVTNDLGEFRLYSLMPGTYVVSATPVDAMVMMPAGPAGPASVSAPDDGHGITYYPGTINVDEAQSITVGLADVANASFALVPQRMTRITGVVRNSQGKPFAAALTLRTQAGGAMSMRMLAMSGLDGRFTASNVPPGEHSIEVSPRPGEEESASVPITAAGQDIADLVITTSPGITISGQVIFEGAAPAEKTFRVNAMSPDPGAPGPMRIFDNTQGVIDEKGRFQLRGLSGRLMFTVFPSAPMAGPLPWFVKSVTFNGENITDVPLDVAGVTDGSTLQIVMTDKQTTLSGAVRNTRGQPVIDYTVVDFSIAAAGGRQCPGVTRASCAPINKADSRREAFRRETILAAAVESLEVGGHWDPAFRKQVEPAAKQFRLTEGQAATIDLTLTP